MVPPVAVIDAEKVAPEKAVACLDIDQGLVAPKPHPAGRGRPDRFHHKWHRGNDCGGDDECRRGGTGRGLGGGTG